MSDIKEEYVNPLNEPAKHALSICLKELKYGRPASTQMLLDTLIAMAKRHEETDLTAFMGVV
jgi:hypothetical protein